MVKVKAADYSGNYFVGECGIASFVVKRMDEVRGNGTIEDAERKIDMLAEMVGFIAETMSKDKQIEFLEKFGGYSWEIAGD